MQGERPYDTWSIGVMSLPCERKKAARISQGGDVDSNFGLRPHPYIGTYASEWMLLPMSIDSSAAILAYFFWLRKGFSYSPPEKHQGSNPSHPFVHHTLLLISICRPSWINCPSDDFVIPCSWQNLAGWFL